MVATVTPLRLLTANAKKLLAIEMCGFSTPALQGAGRIQVSFISTVSNRRNDTDQISKSERQKLREMPLDGRLLRHLDTLKVGYISKRRARVQVARKLPPLTRQYRPPPGKSSAQQAPLRVYKPSNIAEAAKESASSPSPIGSPYPFNKRGETVTRISDPSFDALPIFQGSPPEIAIIGRSNVGKSTLLNALVGYDNSFVQKAIVSSKPGETTGLTFYSLGDSPKKDKHFTSQEVVGDSAQSSFSLRPSLLLVDMPGYGFAYLNEDDRARTEMLCTLYLASNEAAKKTCNDPHPLSKYGLWSTAKVRGSVLKRVLLLLDARHGIKLADIQFLQKLEQDFAPFWEESKEARQHSPSVQQFPGGVKSVNALNRSPSWKLQVVLTKCDLVERNELCRRISLIDSTLFEKLPRFYRSLLPLVPVSAVEQRGIQELKRELAALVPR